MLKDKTELPEKMTNRARVYMGIATVRHLALGLLLFTAPQVFDGPVYAALVDAIPLNGTSADHLRLWGVAMLITALLSVWSVLTANPSHARTGLKASIAMTAGLLSGLIVAVILPEYSIGGYSMFVLLGALLLKDMSMLRDPLRNPFEAVAEVIRDNHQGGEQVSMEEVDREIADSHREWQERGLDGH